eukprot:Rhum_TRINITY_DN22778_c0_g1::Rhum_TRINITY_DN22778_c0_g1_i1::g.176013::m.176013
MHKQGKQGCASHKDKVVVLIKTNVVVVDGDDAKIVVVRVRTGRQGKVLCDRDQWVSRALDVFPQPRHEPLSLVGRRDVETEQARRVQVPHGQGAAVRVGCLAHVRRRGEGRLHVVRVHEDELRPAVADDVERVVRPPPDHADAPGALQAPLQRAVVRGVDVVQPQPLRDEHEHAVVRLHRLAEGRRVQRRRLQHEHVHALRVQERALPRGLGAHDRLQALGHRGGVEPLSDAPPARLAPLCDVVQRERRVRRVAELVQQHTVGEVARVQVSRQRLEEHHLAAAVHAAPPHVALVRPPAAVRQPGETLPVREPGGAGDGQQGGLRDALVEAHAEHD